MQAESTNATNESVLKVALDHGKASGVIKPRDRVVVCQKVGDASVVKIIELEDQTLVSDCTIILLDLMVHILKLLLQKGFIINS